MEKGSRVDAERGERAEEERARVRPVAQIAERAADASRCWKLPPNERFESELGVEPKYEGIRVPARAAPR